MGFCILEMYCGIFDEADGITELVVSLPKWAFEASAPRHHVSRRTLNNIEPSLLFLRNG